MNKITKRYVTSLLIGIFIGYSLIQITQISKNTPISDARTRIRYHSYSQNTIIQQVDDWEIHFNLFKRYYGSIAIHLNISIVNPTDEIKWITPEKYYYTIEIYEDNDFVYNFTVNLDIFEPEKVFLAPESKHTMVYFWKGKPFHDGVYDIKCRIWLDDKEILLEGISFESFTKLEYLTVREN